MRDSAANLEIKVREVIMQQMGKMQAPKSLGFRV